MYAEKFILFPREIHAQDEKTVPQSQILHTPSVNSTIILTELHRAIS